jgi:hypothetical protein
MMDSLRPHRPSVCAGSPSPFEALLRGDWLRDPEGLRDPVGWLAGRAGHDPEFIAVQLEHEARRLDRPGDRAAADAVAAILAAHRADAPDGRDGDRTRALLDGTIAAMYPGYAEHLARVFVRRRLTRAGEDAGIYHGAALEGLMDAVREYHPADGGLTSYARGRIERALRSEYASEHSAERIGDITAARGVDLSGFAARLGDRTNRTRGRAAAQAKAAIALAVADPDSRLSEAERRLLMAFLDGGAVNLTAAAEQAGMHVSRASQLLPRIARRLLRAAPGLVEDLADAGVVRPGRGRGGPG